jgi:hypothetical protein
MQPITLIGAMLFVAIPSAVTVAETLGPNTVFQGTVAVAATNGTPQTGHVSVQSWKLSGPKEVVHEIPLQGFYIARLLGGAVSTTIDGQTTAQPPGAYWTVKVGATMQVNVLSEIAEIETTVVTK